MVVVWMDGVGLLLVDWIKAGGCVDRLVWSIAEEMEDDLKVANLGCWMPEETSGEGMGDSVRWLLVDWIKCTGCVDKVGWSVAEEMEDDLNPLSLTGLIGNVTPLP